MDDGLHIYVPHAAQFPFICGDFVVLRRTEMIDELRNAIGPALNLFMTRKSRKLPVHFRVPFSHAVFSTIFGVQSVVKIGEAEHATYLGSYCRREYLRRSYAQTTNEIIMRKIENKQNARQLDIQFSYAVYNSAGILQWPEYYEKKNTTRDCEQNLERPTEEIVWEALMANVIEVPRSLLQLEESSIDPTMVVEDNIDPPPSSLRATPVVPLAPSPSLSSSVSPPSLSLLAPSPSLSLAAPPPSCSSVVPSPMLSPLVPSSSLSTFAPSPSLLSVAPSPSLSSLVPPVRLLAFDVALLKPVVQEQWEAELHPFVEYWMPNSHAQ